MPSLNISFSDDEHRQIQEAAKRHNMALKPFVREAALKAASDYRREVLDLADRIATRSAELNKRLE
ncbi:antitoxin Phd [Gordonia sp. NPDC003424]